MNFKFIDNVRCMHDIKPLG